MRLSHRVPDGVGHSYKIHVYAHGGPHTSLGQVCEHNTANQTINSVTHKVMDKNSATALSLLFSLPNNPPPPPPPPPHTHTQVLAVYNANSVLRGC